MVNSKLSLTQNTNFATCRAKNTFFSRIISTTNGIEIGVTSFFAIQFPSHMSNYLSKRSIKNFVCWKITFWKFILLDVRSILRIKQIKFCFGAFLSSRVCFRDFPIITQYFLLDGYIDVEMMTLEFLSLQVTR